MPGELDTSGAVVGTRIEFNASEAPEAREAWSARWEVAARSAKELALDGLYFANHRGSRSEVFVDDEGDSTRATTIQHNGHLVWSAMVSRPPVLKGEHAIHPVHVEVGRAWPRPGFPSPESPRDVLAGLNGARFARASGVFVELLGDEAVDVGAAGARAKIADNPVGVAAVVFTLGDSVKLPPPNGVTDRVRRYLPGRRQPEPVDAQARFEYRVEANNRGELVAMTETIITPPSRTIIPLGGLEAYSERMVGGMRDLQRPDLELQGLLREASTDITTSDCYRTPTEPQQRS